MLRRLIEWGGSGARAFCLEQQSGISIESDLVLRGLGFQVVWFHPGRVGDGHQLMRLRGLLALERSADPGI